MVSAYQELPGMGVAYQIGEDQYLCGGERLLAKYEIDTSSLPHANIYLAKNGVVLGYLTVSDLLMRSPTPRNPCGSLKCWESKKLLFSPVTMLVPLKKSGRKAVRIRYGLNFCPRIKCPTWNRSSKAGPLFSSVTA